MRIYEVKSSYTLQPGPATFIERVRQLHAILAHIVRIDSPAIRYSCFPLNSDLWCIEFLQGFSSDAPK
jgi:hypothetical protein